jgi:pimeloyl-ACP methyl ester carboxylesterase
MRHLLALLLWLVLLLPAAPTRAADPCAERVTEGKAWQTRSGCLRLFWDRQDPEQGTFPLYYELSEPRGASLGNLMVFHGGPAYPRHHLQTRGPLWEGLRAHYRILYFHQRGSGNSARVATREELEGREHLFTLDHIVDDSLELHDRILDGAPVVLMGKSAGGFIALKFALRRPEAVQRLVLAATSAYHGYISQRDRVKEEYLRGLERRYPGYLERRRRALELLQPGFLANLLPVPELLLRVDLLENVTFDLSYTLSGQFESVAITRDIAERRYDLLLERLAAGRKTLRSTGLESVVVLNHITCREFAFARSNPAACVGGEEAEELYDLRRELTRLQVPTLVLSGRFDPILPPEFQASIVDHYGGPVEWHILELAAHMLFLEQPRATATLVLDFLGVERQQPAQLPGL